MKAKISEIFDSIQGEGIYLGERQVFVRFFGCNLKCSFCDTPLSNFREYSVEELGRELAAFSGYHSVSLTGGEPLCQVEFLESFLKESSGPGKTFYLETNGTLPSALERVIEHIGIVAMDFKLPSSCGNGPFWKEHEEFLKIAVCRDVFIKMVVTGNTQAGDIAMAANIVRRVNPLVPVVLQPEGTQWSHLCEKMLGFKSMLELRGVGQVKMVPQAHKLVGIK
jgi:7-carboxy-7-deazaguanine synthase